MYKKKNWTLTVIYLTLWCLCNYYAQQLLYMYQFNIIFNCILYIHKLISKMIVKTDNPEANFMVLMISTPSLYKA